jgi:hypothetical protein
MPVPLKTAWIPPDHEQRLADHLERVKNECISCAQQVLDKAGDQITVTRMAQFVVLVLLQHVFGLTPGALDSMLDSSSFSKVRAWIADLDGTFPGGSTGYKHFADILEHVGDEINRIAGNVQDAFQLDVGKMAREKFTSILDAQRIKLVPGADCFIGMIPPNEIPGAFPVLGRGVLLPFLNAWIYMHGRKITSTCEFIGLLKTPEIEGGMLYFPLAGALGFFRGPPGKNEIYAWFRQIDQILGDMNKDLSIELAKAGLMEMTVVTIDTTNIPVDKKDKTGSIGTGSRGTFYGHKEAISIDANCIPIAGATYDGRKGDATTFDGVFEPAKDVSNRTGRVFGTGHRR